VASRSGRLGRGLSALLGDATPTEAPGRGLIELPLAAIRPNPLQPRRHIDAAGLRALAESIAASGVVQPVVVRPLEEPDERDARYELIAGERRWRAAARAGLARIPALVREADEAERLELALVENLVREDLNALEAARACATLVEDFGQTQAALAERLGRSRPAISNLLRLLELPEDVQDLVARGKLSEGHARAVLMADGARARRRTAERAAREGLSVRQTEDLARRSAPPARRRRHPPPAMGDEAARAFSVAFDAPTRVRVAGDGLVVELRFADEDALRAALDRLSEPA
jgi:ParB family chromosome partitioning protein